MRRRSARITTATAAAKRKRKESEADSKITIVCHYYLHKKTVLKADPSRTWDSIRCELKAGRLLFQGLEANDLRNWWCLHAGHTGHNECDSISQTR